MIVAGIPRKPLWEEALREAAASLEGGLKGLPSLKGFDADPDTIQYALHNAERAGVRRRVHFERRELGALRGRDFADQGLLATNPPWGERLDEQTSAAWLSRRPWPKSSHHLPALRHRSK